MPIIRLFFQIESLLDKQLNLILVTTMQKIVLSSQDNSVPRNVDLNPEHQSVYIEWAVFDRSTNPETVVPLEQLTGASLTFRKQIGDTTAFLDFENGFYNLTVDQFIERSLIIGRSLEVTVAGLGVNQVLKLFIFQTV